MAMRCVICLLIVLSAFEPTAILLAFHEHHDTPVADIYLVRADMSEFDPEPHTHEESKALFGVNDTVVVASGTATPRITKSLGYTVDALLADRQTKSFTMDATVVNGSITS